MSEGDDRLRHIAEELMALHPLPSPEREQRSAALTRDLSGEDRVALGSLLRAMAAHEAAADDPIARLAARFKELEATGEDAAVAMVRGLTPEDREAVGGRLALEMRHLQLVRLLLLGTRPRDRDAIGPEDPLYQQDLQMQWSEYDAVSALAWQLALRVPDPNASVDDMLRALDALSEDPEFAEQAATAWTYLRAGEHDAAGE